MKFFSQYYSARPLDRGRGVLRQSVNGRCQYVQDDCTCRLDDELFPLLSGQPAQGSGAYTSQSIREVYRRCLENGDELDVQSRREAVWIGFKAFGFFLPAGTDELIGGEASESLETLGKVRGVEERAEVLS